MGPVILPGAYPPYRGPSSCTPLIMRNPQYLSLPPRCCCCGGCVSRFVGTCTQDDGDGKENCLAEADKDTIKANIVPLMCRAPPEVQRQVIYLVHLRVKKFYPSDSL